jgi:predicted nuclease with TOPRIM domain
LRDEIKKLKTALGETAIESEDFGKTLNTLNDKQNELKELTKVNVSESAKLRKEFKQLKDELLTLEEGTEEYNDKLK